MADIWLRPWASLDNVTVNGTGVNLLGTAIDLEGVKSEHSVQWNLSSTTNMTYALALEGSLDNVNWFTVSQHPFFNTTVGPDNYHFAPITTLNMPAIYLRVKGTATATNGIVTVLVTSA